MFTQSITSKKGQGDEGGSGQLHRDCGEETHGEKKKVKEANESIEVARNKEEVKKKRKKKKAVVGEGEEEKSSRQKSNSSSLLGFFQTGSPATSHRSWLKPGRQT